MKKLMIGLLTLALVLVCSLTAVMPVSAMSPPPTGIVRATISPVKSTIAAGNPQTYVVTGYDASNTHFDISRWCIFIIDPAAGGSWSSNTFHSAVKGTFSLFALFAGLPAPIIATLTVTYGPAVSLAVLPVDGTAVAGSPKAFSAFATDAGGNTVNVTSSTDFSIDEDAGGSWTVNRYTKTYSPEVPGTWTVTATYGSLTPVTTTLTVTHGVAVSVAILPADGTAAAGSSKAFSAFATDAWGNTFNVTSATTFYIQKGAGGSWTANKYTKSYSPEVPGTWTVYADYGSLPEATTTLTVTHGVAVSIAISPRNPSVLAGGTKNFCAVATDAWSNTFNVTKSTDFSITAGAGGSWSLNKYDTTYTSSAKGVWTVTATYGSLTDGVKLTVK